MYIFMQFNLTGRRKRSECLVEHPHRMPRADNKPTTLFRIYIFAHLEQYP